MGEYLQIGESSIEGNLRIPRNDGLDHARHFVLSRDDGRDRDHPEKGRETSRKSQGEVQLGHVDPSRSAEHSLKLRAANQDAASPRGARMRAVGMRATFAARQLQAV